jgi:hypothetical protein
MFVMSYTMFYLLCTMFAHFSLQCFWPISGCDTCMLYCVLLHCSHASVDFFVYTHFLSSSTHFPLPSSHHTANKGHLKKNENGQERTCRQHGLVWIHIDLIHSHACALQHCCALFLYLLCTCLRTSACNASDPSLGVIRVCCILFLIILTHKCRRLLLHSLPVLLHTLSTSLISSHRREGW